ncbi:hypothetical protein Psyr_2348 [Pseudomonas syringae pv. syringae B728a]|uniref:Uncharacterized protein n=1 Tax=Pseudomonas syringae pv. syringae (strain B728a) TaxID=205918 RepID=Q4ZTY5_PSEU2|nr:hypothetical protein Psyr_2348 [Pseudomonas syringae pv. syringae B728a]PYD19328.1 hypothetical protein DND47_01635 [Pseudomonas syringae pv. syringae]
MKPTRSSFQLSYSRGCKKAKTPLLLPDMHKNKEESVKSRNLHTIHDLIVKDYSVNPTSSGKFLHQFSPSTTDTVYQFETNSSAHELVNGHRYNIGYTIDKSGRRIIEPSALGKADSVNPILSYLAAKQLSEDKLSENKGKNDERVKHKAKDGYYWGKKYAWRRYGLVFAKGAFYKYLEHINHPFVSCKTVSGDVGIYSNEESIAYKDEGLEAAMDALIDSAVKKGRYYESPLYKGSFQIRPISAISDKK